VLNRTFLTEQEIASITIDHYMLGAKFYGKILKKGHTGIYVHESLPFSTISLQEFCTEQDIEVVLDKITNHYAICSDRL
jgi:hypothetical protein